MKKIFTKDYLVEELELPWCNSPYFLRDEVYDADYKNNIYHRLIFEDKDGSAWETIYWENLYETCWQYDNEIECIQVIPQKIAVYDYIPIEESERYRKELYESIMEDDGK